MDVGLESFATLSNGEQIDNPVKWLRKVLQENPALIQTLPFKDFETKRELQQQDQAVLDLFVQHCEVRLALVEKLFAGFDRSVGLEQTLQHRVAEQLAVGARGSACGAEV